MISEQVVMAGIGAAVTLSTLLVINIFAPGLKWRQDELGKVRDGQEKKIENLELEVAKLRVEIDSWQERFWTASALGVEQNSKIEHLQQSLDAANSELNECRERALAFSAELHDLKNKMQLLQLRQETKDRPRSS
jgi:peptidoglycan hydrolase CwlO-like protein